MPEEDGHGVPVADAIELLRSELESALAQGQGRRVQFGVSDVSLTLSVVASRSRGVDGKLRWWVVEAGGSAGSSRELTQTLVLTLQPQLIGPDKSRGPLEVGADDTEAVGGRDHG